MPTPSAPVAPTTLRFAEARFRHAWRPYQARILQTLDRHLHDDHLHVVAPPGSGKTVLGLEALRRLGRPALVLAPTLTIREQWITRLRDDFAVDEPADALGTKLCLPTWLENSRSLVEQRLAPLRLPLH